MLPRVQPYQPAGSGEANTGLFEDIGTRSLQTVRVGEGAGKVSSGTANTFIGYESGRANSGGSYDTFIGYQAGSLNANASYSTFIGAYAGRENQGGSECVMIGFRAGELNRDGKALVAIGSHAMRENVSGTGSVAIGWRAAERNLDGDYNTMVGAECGQDNRSGQNNTMCGFRSGRANFEGSENTYVGAYTGYSNQSGSGNCLVGYKSGENMAFGACNVAIGAFAFQRASNLSMCVAIGPYAGADSTSGTESVLIGAYAAACNVDGGHNVMIGVFAGRSNVSDSNVFIGHSAAVNSTADETVVIGTRAAPSMAGGKSVIVGCGTATRLIYGECNVFVGVGADAYTPDVRNGISIGTFNTFTSSHSITVGESIFNERPYCVLLGSKLQSDADYSVLMGNRINVQSVLFFKDPVNWYLKDNVARDALAKLGITHITYGTDDSLLKAADSSVIYTNGVASVATSNIVNSTTNRPFGVLPSSNFDLIYSVAPEYAAIVTQGRAFALTTDEAICPVNVYTSNHYTASWPVTAVPSVVSLHTSNFFLTHACNVAVPLHEAPSGVPLIRNIRDFTTTTQTAGTVRYEFPKRIATPVLPFTVDQPRTVDIDTPVLASVHEWATLMQLDGITLTSDGIRQQLQNSRVRVVVETPPTTMALDKSIYEIGDPVRFKIHRDAAFAVDDFFVVQAVHEVTDAAGNTYGVPGTRGKVVVRYNNVTAQRLTLRRSGFLNASNVALTTRDVGGVPTFVDSDEVIILALDSQCTITSNTFVFDSNVAALLVREGVYTTYTDAQYQNNVRALSPYINIAITELTSNYTSVVGPPSRTLSLYIDDVLVGNPDIQELYDARQYAQQLPITISSADATYAMLSNVTLSLTNNVLLPFDDRQQIGHDMADITTAFYSYPWTASCNAHIAILDNVQGTGTVPSIDQLRGLYVATSNVLATYAIPRPVWEQTLNEFSSQVCNVLIYKYFELPRIPLTYGDIRNERLRITVTSDADVTPFAVRLSIAGTNTVDFTGMYGRNTKWESIPNAIAAPTTIAVTPGQSSALAIPSETVIPVSFPSHGFYDITSHTYTPFDPFAASDVMKFVATSNDIYTEEITQTFEFNPAYTIVAPEIHCLAYTYGQVDTTATEDILIRANPFVNSVSPIYDLYYITIRDFTQSPAQTQNNSYSVVRETYSVNEGYKTNEQTITITSQLDPPVVFVGDSAGVTTQTHTTVQSGTSKDVFGNITDLAVPETSFQVQVNNGTDYNSNVNITSNVVISEVWRRALNTVNSNVISDSNLWFFFDAQNPSRLMLTSNTYIDRSEPLPIGTNEVPTTVASTSNLTYEFQRRVTHSNYEPFHFLNRNVLFRRGASYTTPDNVLIRAGVGDVQAFTQTDVDSRNIAIRVSRLAGSSSQVRLSINGGAQQSIGIVRYASENIVVPDTTSVAVTRLFNAGPTRDINSVLTAAASSLPFVPETVHIVDVRNGWLGGGMAVPYDTSLIYTMTSNYASDSVTYFYTSNNVATTPVTATITIHRRPYYDYQYFNTGLSLTDSSVLTYGAFNIQSGDSVINFTLNHPEYVTINQDPINIADLRAGRVRVEFLTNSPARMAYASDDVDGLFTMIPYTHNAFPRASHVAEERLTIAQLGTDADVRNVIDPTGPLWSAIGAARDQGHFIASNEIKIHILNRSSMAEGFFWNTAASNEYAWMFTFDDVLAHRLRYIPNSPNANSNVSLNIQCRYKSVLSPVYKLDIKNYISRFPNIALCNGYRTPYEFDASAVLRRSAGLIADGIQWSPARLTVHQGAPTTPPPVFTIQGTAYTWPIALYASSDPVRFDPVVTQLNMVVDQADSCSLRSILDKVLFDTSSQKVAGIRFYLVTPPQRGYVQNIRTKSAAISFTDADLLADDIWYQHRGRGGSEDVQDVVEIGISTTPFDMASVLLRIAIQVRLIPYTTLNRKAFIYVNTLSAAAASNNTFASSLGVTGGTSSSYIHVVGSSEAHVVGSDGSAPVYTFPTSNIQTNQVSYKISTPSAFVNANPPMLLDLVANNSATEGYVNPLIGIHDVYRSKFVTRFEAFVNRYFSSNVRIPAMERERTMKLRYEFDASEAGFSNVYNRVFFHAFQFRPYQDLSPADFATADGVAGSAFLRRFRFDIHYRGEHDAALLSIAFRHDGTTVTTPQRTVEVAYKPDFPITFNTWNNILFTNEDNENNRQCSLYIGYDPQGTRQFNTPRNLLYGLGIDKIAVEAIRAIEIIVDTEHVDNYKGALYTSNVSGDVATGAMGRYVEVSQYNTKLEYRNSEIYVTTYSLNEAVNAQLTDEVHNVIVGKNIYVKGANNVCLGNMFNTSGQFSIVIGNNIGSASGNDIAQANELYQCIIIGNRSFQNSLTRDTICIGNNNFNALNTYSPAAVNTFLSRKPIIIGNDIEDALDYSINVGDTFLKSASTEVPGVYLGRRSEPVCIGYTSNMEFPSSSYKLRVNGGVVGDRFVTAYASAAALEVGMVVDSDLMEATAAMAKDVIGVVTYVEGNSVCVQNRGVADVRVHTPINKGDLLTVKAGGGLQPQGDDIVRSYTVAKALSTVAGAGMTLLPCLMLV